MDFLLIELLSSVCVRIAMLCLNSQLNVYCSLVFCSDVLMTSSFFSAMEPRFSINLFEGLVFDCRLDFSSWGSARDQLSVNGHKSCFCTAYVCLVILVYDDMMSFGVEMSFCRF